MNKSLFLKVISSFILLGITLALCGCQQLNVIQSQVSTKSRNTEQEIKPVIENYIQSEIFLKDFFGSGSINGKIFCSYHFLGVDQKNENKNTINTYIWLLCDEYNIKIKRGSAASIPIVVILKNQENKYQTVNHQYPRDGASYSEDVKKLFPTDVRRKISDLDQNKIVNYLNLENIKKAQIYFK